MLIIGRSVRVQQAALQGTESGEVLRGTPPARLGATAQGTDAGADVSDVLVKLVGVYADSLITTNDQTMIRANDHSLITARSQPDHSLIKA